MPQQHIWLLPQNWGYLVSFGTYFFKNFTKIFQKWLFWSVWESSICKVKKEETIHFTHFNMAIDYVRGVFSRHTLSPNRVKSILDLARSRFWLCAWIYIEIHKIKVVNLNKIYISLCINVTVSFTKFKLNKKIKKEVRFFCVFWILI